jgi:hypothetical protein
MLPQLREALRDQKALEIFQLSQLRFMKNVLREEITTHSNASETP